MCSDLEIAGRLRGFILLSRSARARELASRIRKTAEIRSLVELRRLLAPRWLPNPNRLKRFVNLVLGHLLPALHALHEGIDFEALLRKGGVVLVSFASFALRGVRGLLQLGYRLGVGLSCGAIPRKFRRIRPEPASTESKPPFRPQKMLKVSSLDSNLLFNISTE